MFANIEAALYPIVCDINTYLLKFLRLSALGYKSICSPPAHVTSTVAQGIPFYCQATNTFIQGLARIFMFYFSLCSFLSYL